MTGVWHEQFHEGGTAAWGGSLPRWMYHTQIRMITASKSIIQERGDVNDL